MGSNNNKKQAQAQPQQGQQQQWGNDPRGTSMNMINQQVDRFNQQQGPLANEMAMNYGRGSEANYGDYTDIMNQYRGIASGSDAADYDPGGGGGGGGGYSAFTVNPERVTAERANAQYANTERAAAARALGPLERVTAKDQYGAPEAGYQEFSQTGGYSPADIANLRARGTSPIRAAYANAERAVGQQRSLQGGYAPNAIAAQVKMAREQGQGMADASQNVDAGIAAARNAGRLSGFAGLTDIGKARQDAQMQGDIFNAGQSNEGQKFDIGNEMNTNQFNAGQGNQVGMFNAGQGNDVSMFNAGQGNDVGKFNADLNYQGQVYNANAQSQAQAANNAASAASSGRAAAANAQNMDDRFRALSGMTTLYGATPGMANTFGNQALQAVGQQGQFGLGAMSATNQAGQGQGAFDQAAGRINTGLDIGNRILTGANSLLNNRSNSGSGGYTGAPMNTGSNPTFGQGTTFGGGNTNSGTSTYNPMGGGGLQYPSQTRNRSYSFGG